MRVHPCVHVSHCRISRGKQECLYLGNLESQRDWGHARDYVEVITTKYATAYHYMRCYNAQLSLI